MATTVSYKGNEIANFESGTKTLKTSGKYCEGDITIQSAGGITPSGSINITENGTYDVTHFETANVNTPLIETEVLKKTPIFNNAYNYVLSFNTTKGKIPKAFELINTDPNAEGIKIIILLNERAFGHSVNIGNHRDVWAEWYLNEPPISFTNGTGKYSMTVSEIAFTSAQYNLCFISGNEYQLTCYYWD